MTPAPAATLHLTNAYHASSGGIRTFYRALLAAADRAGRRVCLVVPSDRDGVEDVGRCGRIHHVQARPAPAFDRRYRTLLPDFYLPPEGSRLAQILAEERPDVVEVCDKYSLPYVAALLRKGWMPRAGRPALIGLSCERMDDNVAAYVGGGVAAARFCRWYMRHVYGPPFDVHVANSDYTAAELHACLFDRPAGFIRVLPMGVDVDGFDPSRRSGALRARLLARAGGRDASTLLFYAGRLSPEKHVGLLLEALAWLVTGPQPDGRDYRLVIAGDGPSADGLRRVACRDVPGRVLFLGAIRDRAALARYYASADVFVHPNPKEPFGIAPLEAMASGVPVVVPDAGGVTTYAHAGNAWVAAPVPAAFAAAIRAAAIGDAGRRTAALRTAHEHGWPDAAARFFGLYDQLDAARPQAWRRPCARRPARAG